MTFWKNLVVALVAAFALAACSSSNDNGDSTSGGTPPPEPTPAERQMTLIENAQAGLDTALDGLDADDPTADQIKAVTGAMSLLEDALAGANDLSPSDTEEAREDLAGAMTAYMDAQETLRTGMDRDTRITTQMKGIDEARKALSEALDGEEISDLAAANEAYGDLKFAIDAGDALTDTQKASAVSDLNMADVAIANAELAMYETSAMAEGAMLEDMLTAYQGKLAAARRLAAATAASVSDRATANQAIGEAMAKIAQLTDDIQEEADDAADKRRMASNDAAMQVAEAINKHAVQGHPPAEFRNTNTTTPENVLTFSRDTGAAKITPYQSSADKKNNPFTTGAAQDAGPGWAGMTFTRSGIESKKSFTEMAAAYTDIEALKDELWVAATFPSGVTLGTANALTIPTTAKIPAGRFGGAAAVPAYVKGQTNYRNVGADGLVGTLYGVAGSFSCDGSECTLRQDEQGMVESSAELTFTPASDTFDADTTLAKGVMPDSDYTHFGYWAKKVKQRDGSYVHDIETFHGGKQGNSLTSVLANETNGVTGTATYYGAAAGVYVKKDGAGDSLVVSDGMFTADAMLKANFEGPSIAIDDRNSISGTISGFMDGSTDLGFADLTLRGSTDAQDGALFTAATSGAFSGETDGGGTSGSWSGQFYGNANPGNDNPDGNGPDMTNDYPMNVSGEFNGHFVNGHVAGAFGAEYDD